MIFTIKQKLNYNIIIQKFIKERLFYDILNWNKYKFKLQQKLLFHILQLSIVSCGGKGSSNFSSQMEQTKCYEHKEFITPHCGLRKDIDIDQDLVLSMLDYTRFSSINELYYWLDSSTSMQMIKKQPKKLFINGEFDFAVINCEFRDNDCNNDIFLIVKSKREDYRKTVQYESRTNYPCLVPTSITNLITDFLYDPKQYGYYVHSFETRQWILDLGYSESYLPKISRDNDFSRLLLCPPERLPEFDGDNLIRNLIFYNANTSSSSITLSIKIFIQYYNLAIISMEYPLSPMLIIDKYNNKYWIEWLLFVHIIHKDTYIGVTITYHKGRYVPKRIFLSKKSIKRYNKILNPQYHIKKFPYMKKIRKLKWKS